MGNPALPRECPVFYPFHHAQQVKCSIPETFERARQSLFKSLRAALPEFPIMEPLNTVKTLTKPLLISTRAPVLDASSIQEETH